MDGFLLKPLELETVRRLLDQVRLRRAQAARLRAFTLYAQAGGPGDAVERLSAAIGAELAALRAGEAADSRTQVHAAAHRLRSLAGLVQARDLKGLAVQLEERAATLTAPELTQLIQAATAAARRLQDELGATRGPAPDPAPAERE